MKAMALRTQAPAEQHPLEFVDRAPPDPDEPRQLAEVPRRIDQQPVPTADSVIDLPGNSHFLPYMVFARQSF